MEEQCWYVYFFIFFINSHAKHTTTYMHVNQLKQRLDETNKIHSLEKKKVSWYVFVKIKDTMEIQLKKRIYYF